MSRGRAKVQRRCVRPVQGMLSLALILAPSLAEADPPQNGRIVLATTTSTANTGLLDEILPAFEKETGLEVHYLAVGTGASLRLGENGDVDLLLVHAPEAEEAFVRAGHGLARVSVMCNEFVILGPPDDPASVTGSGNAVEAFHRIARHGGVPFVSRGDGSGTHRMEQAIWRAAGIVPDPSWHVETGQGMGACLMIAGEMGAYTLSDIGTYLSQGDRLEIVSLFEGDPMLRNPYSLIAVAPALRPRGNHEGALRLIGWLTSSEGQARIATFRVNGRSLFQTGEACGSRR